MANLFLHYAFDAWMARKFPGVRFERYCDDAVVRCASERHAKPELLAERPNEVWSWDITKLLGPAKWTCFYLYVVLDVFSCYCAGWTVQHRESVGASRRRATRSEAEAARTGRRPDAPRHKRPGTEVPGKHGARNATGPAAGPVKESDR